MAKTKTLKLGRPVTYTDSSGFPKAAIVVGTPETIVAHGTVTCPDTGRAHLEVHSPTGKVYPKTNIAEGEGPGTFQRT